MTKKELIKGATYRVHGFNCDILPRNSIVVFTGEMTADGKSAKVRMGSGRVDNIEPDKIEKFEGETKQCPGSKRLFPIHEPFVKFGKDMVHPRYKERLTKHNRN